MSDLPGGKNRFRTSFTHVEGLEPSYTVQGKVVNLNLVNWTVDVVTQFDQKRYFEVQVGSPYVHYSNGEGFSVFPEIGSKCMVCLPSDSSPPYVQSFIMPVETVDMAADDAPKGITSQSRPNRTSSGASFAGGRPRVKPGDVLLRTRDDNFLILHRGGVVQIGATELAQRIYIPLNNFIMDVSENYAHYNTGGSVLWSVQAVPTLEKLPTEYTHTFRVYANEKYADIRIRAGKVSDPVTEAGSSLLSQLGIGQGDDTMIVYEVDVAKNGFDTQNGSLANAGVAKQLSMRFFFDRSGGVFLYSKSSMVVNIEKKLSIHAGGGVQFTTDADFSVAAKNGAIIDGGTLAHIKGNVVKLGPGSKPVATQGAMVKIALPYTPMPTPGAPPVVLYGTVITGSPTVLA